MTLNLITFASYLHDAAVIQSAHAGLLTELEKHFAVNIVDYKNISSLGKNDFKILFIATGGVEQLVVDTFDRLSQPVILLADGLQNSLAASLEISSWLSGQQVQSEILHGEPEAIIARIQTLHSNFKAQHVLAGTRIGVIGTPSSWLIASGVSYSHAQQKWGVSFVDINMQRVYDYYEQISDGEVMELSESFTTKASACYEASPEDIMKAARLYKAIRRICEEEKLSALTIKCFSILETKATTGCLALALLNDEGIVAGCEGDLQSIFTLVVAKAVTGQTGFMANPSMINPRTNEMTLAHCTVGLAQTESYIIRSHFESGIGVAIQGVLPLGEVTVLRFGGVGLDSYFLSAGQLFENTNNTNMCRTQVRVKLNHPVDYFLTNPLGNHHIVIQGNHEDKLKYFFNSKKCKQYE